MLFFLDALLSQSTIFESICLIPIRMRTISEQAYFPLPLMIRYNSFQSELSAIEMAPTVLYIHPDQLDVAIMAQAIIYKQILICR